MGHHQVLGRAVVWNHAVIPGHPFKGPVFPAVQAAVEIMATRLRDRGGPVIQGRVSNLGQGKSAR